MCHKYLCPGSRWQAQTINLNLSVLSKLQELFFPWFCGCRNVLTSVASELSWPRTWVSDSHTYSQAISLFSIAVKHLPCESLSLWFWCIGRCKMEWDRNVLRILFSPLQRNHSYVFVLLFYISVSNLSPSLLCIYSLPHLKILQITAVFFFPTAVPIISSCSHLQTSWGLFFNDRRYSLPCHHHLFSL